MSRPRSEDGGPLPRRRRPGGAPAAALLGHRPLAVDAGQGTVEAAFEAEPHLFNPAGVMQGGFIIAMLDLAMLDAAAALAGPGYDAVLLETQCNFLAAVGPGSLLCRAAMLRQGRSTAFLEGRLFNGAGELAATATGVIALRPRGNAAQ